MNTCVANCLSRLLAGRVRASVFGLLAICLCTPAFASRIKDVTLIEGGRDNQLVGYGLIVGLAGDGDSNSQTTLR
ncbi:MAG: flagellar basal body P-ring protein FlgI, partial [Opitutaceae bacterium]